MPCPSSLSGVGKARLIVQREAKDDSVLLVCKKGIFNALLSRIGALRSGIRLVQAMPMSQQQ